jgi:anti-anti-sigma regulatory factor
MQPLANLSATTFSNPISTLESSRPRTVVLRPNGCLDEISSPSFMKALEQALDLTSETVIVDLLWVDSVQSEGIACLISGLKRASVLGKTLSLRFMDVATQSSVKTACER